MIKRIHVNKHHIAANRKAGDAAKPPFTVKTSKGNTTGHEVEVEGGCIFIYRPEHPLSCGAVAWAHTTDRVWVDGKEVK